MPNLQSNNSIASTMRFCSVMGGTGSKKSEIKFLLILCCPAVPVKFFFPPSINKWLLNIHRKKFIQRNLVLSRSTWSSVVAAPWWLGRFTKTADLRFWKHGVIFAITISLSWRCVNPFFRSFHFLVSRECLLWNHSCNKDIGINPTITSSAMVLRGLSWKNIPHLVHSQEAGISKGISSSMQRSTPFNFS